MKQKLLKSAISGVRNWRSLTSNPNVRISNQILNTLHLHTGSFRKGRHSILIAKPVRPYKPRDEKNQFKIENPNILFRTCKNFYLEDKAQIAQAASPPSICPWIFNLGSYLVIKIIFPSHEAAGTVQKYFRFPKFNFLIFSYIKIIKIKLLIMILILMEGTLDVI